MAMKLDLDAFLDSHASDDDDDVNLLSVHGRTVDEILLNESSSSDSSLSSPSRDQPSYRDATGNLKLSPDHTSSSPPKFIDKLQLPSSYFQSHVEFSSTADSFSLNRTTHRNVLPPLFTGNSSSGVSVRSNVKPGAALAAAAAASRSVPTPHAAAIKLRRATTTNAPLLHKAVVDNNDGFVSKSSSLDSDVVSELLFGFQSQVTSGAVSEISKSDFNSSHSSQTGEVTLVNNGLSLSLGAGITVKDNFNNEANEVLPLEGIKTQTEGVQNVIETNELTVDNFVEVSSSSIFEPHITTTPSVTEQGQQNLNEYCINSDETGADVNSELLTVNESIENAAGYDNATKVEEDLTFSKAETHDLEDVIPQFEEDEEVSLAGKDNILPSDGSEPVEDIILQLESTAGCERTGKKSQSSMKPLALAEKLEKKYAFTGLHWEEGAASLPCIVLGDP